MKVIGLDHRGIRTANLEASRHFYEDLIGLQQGNRPGALATKGYWLYAGDTPIIHLIEDSDGTTSPPQGLSETLVDSGGRTHVALTVEGGRAAVERMNDAGVPYWDRLFKNPVMYQVFVEDPNGLLIELIDRNPGNIDGPICKVVA
ncbi:MAG: VOC family protein [Rhodospirillales bacterium]|nr:VOC family protein [Rhodospirillales bacterium]